MELDKLKALAEAVTGTWYDAITIGDALERADLCTTPEVDAPFIAACSPTTIKALVEELKRWRKSFGEWEAWK